MIVASVSNLVIFSATFFRVQYTSSVHDTVMQQRRDQPKSRIPLPQLQAFNANFKQLSAGTKTNIYEEINDINPI